MHISSPQKSSLFELPPIFQGIRKACPGDASFPSNLAGSPFCPGHLFYRGQLASSDSHAVAIVGSRACSPAGESQAFRLAQELAQAGVCIISGLAQGIDGAAHRGALAGGGRTLAVLGTGLNHVYPYEHRELGEQIASRGAIVSQFFPCFTGYAGGSNFRKRNGILAGLSQLLIVVEAQLHSGTADTIRKALAQGRKVGLLSSLVESQQWAAQLAEHPQVFTVREAYCVLERLEA